MIIIKDIIKNKSFPENLKGILFFPLLVLLPQLGQDVGVALQPVVGEQAVGAVFDAPAHHKTAPAVGHPVEGAVAEEAVEFLLPHALVAGEVFTFFVLKPGVVLAGHVHGGFSSQFKLMQTAPAGKPAGAVVCRCGITCCGRLRRSPGPAGRRGGARWASTAPSG